MARVGKVFQVKQLIFKWDGKVDLKATNYVLDFVFDKNENLTCPVVERNYIMEGRNLEETKLLDRHSKKFQLEASAIWLDSN